MRERLVHLRVLTWSSILETVRRKDLYVVVLLAVFGVGGGSALAAVGVRGIETFLRNIVLTVVNLLSVAICVWLAARQLRLERERACDEAVLDTGARASEYCGHLVEIMRAAARGPGVVVGAGMAAPSTLEFRVRSLLGEPRPRRFRLRGVVLAVCAVAIYGLGILTPCVHGR